MVENIFSLKKKVILITGATGHLGFEISRRIIDCNATVILTSKNIDNLKKTQNFFLKNKKNVDIFKMDVTKEKAIKSCLSYIKKRYGKINGVINNAYSGKDGDLNKINPNDFIDATKYNLIAPFLIVKNLLKIYKNVSANNISIVNVASIYGVVSPNFDIYDDKVLFNPIHYGATKAGMIQMTKYLACYLAKKNIRVNSVSPGAFPPMSLLKKNMKFKRNLEMNMPLKRIGLPSEVTGAIIYLLSNASSYLTGQNIIIDGGWTAK